MFYINKVSIRYPNCILLVLKNLCRRGVHQTVKSCCLATCRNRYNPVELLKYKKIHITYGAFNNSLCWYTVELASPYEKKYHYPLH